VTFFGEVEADTVDVLIEFVGLVTDVPVVEGDADTPGLDSLGLENPLPLGGRYDKKESVLVYPPPFPLESLVKAYDDGSSAKKQGTKQTVVMASDVLFGTDVAELSAEAASRVDEVAKQIAAVASGGEIRVVGHTDDVDTEAYNLDLSKRRAASVSAQMKTTLGTSFTLVEEGKGKSQPAVEGTDAAARAANRRVEIEFTATETITLPGQVADIPPATGPVSSGHDPVTYTNGYGGSTTTLTTQVSSVVRHNGYLVGTLVVSNNSSGSPLHNLACNAGNGGNYGADCLRLLGASGYVFPLQHKHDMSDNYFRGLADDRHLQFLDPGYSFTYTVVWPDTGEDSVTVDSPKMFRITDIPVEAG
jgi:outer membrane protein OmpA-like peptidoglycan-associated protein